MTNTKFQEIRALLAIAAPICFSQLCQMAMGITDTILLGGISQSALAIGGLTTSLFFTICLIFQTTLNASGVLIAQALGKKEEYRVATLYTTTFIFSLLLCIPALLILLQTHTILKWIGESDEIITQADGYMRILRWGILPMFLGIGISRVVLPALNAASLLLQVTAVMTVFNGFFNAGLIYGYWGLPKMGLNGSATATMVTLWLSAATLILVTHKKQKLHLYILPLKLELRLLKPMCKLGLPMMAAAAAEMLLFQVTTLRAGLFGTHALAAHEVALNTCTTTYMVILALGQAANVRSGFWTGARNKPMLRRTSKLALVIGGLCMSVIAIGLIVFAPQIAKIFLGRATDFSAQTMQLTVSLLFIAGIFQVVDGLQTVTNGLLRGMGDTTIPMIFCLIGYWGVGFPLGGYLAFNRHFQTQGLWIGLAVGLSVVCVLLLGRIMKLLKRSSRPTALQ